MTALTSEGQKLASDAAERHGVSAGAAEAVLTALAQSGGTQAQFNHPELGGMGQWSRGGMLMIGDMFNNGLKAKVDALCSDLSGGMQGVEVTKGGGAGGPWGGWPQELGRAGATGAQNGVRYAVFPETRRLAIDDGGQMAVYDTGEHVIGGVSQQQGSGRTLTFTSQLGTVRVEDLTRVAGVETSPDATSGPDRDTPVEAALADQTPAPAAASAQAGDDPIAMLERLAKLRDAGILSAEEFDAKKAELLSRI
ncbi:SHOCT domain-containing protein [Pelagovum pacificum]|uniref:SHOCT domain-containing protein n=1 Tax=Pelagovum pacificum TaxID=2588711 RepID=A0A5C5GC72_9RHOB|nr:SHOCT domain-containing protein [Pelagovum pacificum]QQA42121.1 SHOCT domain-containing protein [Pelagovum pacificum]TNY31209.1 SHOCT domain-containing protein [Pelagovum pacificum]